MFFKLISINSILFAIEVEQNKKIVLNIDDDHNKKKKKKNASKNKYNKKKNELNKNNEKTLSTKQDENFDASRSSTIYLLNSIKISYSNEILKRDAIVKLNNKNFLLVENILSTIFIEILLQKRRLRLTSRIDKYLSNYTNKIY